MIKTKLSDSKGTPDWLMNVFKDWFDPCPLNKNPEIDGLDIEWKDKTYVNFPYSNPLPWIEKGIEESKKGKIIIFLMRFDPTTKYFRLLMENNAHIFYCSERLKFKNRDEEYEPYSSPFPSILVILSNNKTFTKPKEEVEQGGKE